MSAGAQKPKPKPNKVAEQIAQLEAELAQAQAQAHRAQADYQNLVRRTQADRAKLINMASREVLEAIIGPFDHLCMAAQQLEDAGLKMVIQEFERVFEQFGLEEIAAEGQNFDPHAMEAVDGSKPGGTKVTAVKIKGYQLAGVVIRPAKVVVE